ncbi:MAG: secD [Rhodospirillales bacterium]|nr:secD [Rhodospirillales bacterium]
MVYFSRWKIGLILAVCAASILFSLPNLFPKASLPAWLPSRQVNLGLDLRGGSYLLMQVDLSALTKERLEGTLDQVRAKLREAKIAYSGLEVRNDGIEVTLRDPAQREAAAAALRDVGTGDGQPAMLGGQGNDFAVTTPAEGVVRLTLTPQAAQAKGAQAIEQSIEIVRRRIDQTGVNEPQIARQGTDRILVQLPGVDDPDRIKRLLGTTAKMNFHLLDDSQTDPTKPAPPGSMWVNSDERGRPGAKYLVKRKIEVSGSNLTDARATTNQQTGQWVVTFRFDSIGSKKFAAITTANVGRPFAIVLDDKAISVPVIQEPITGGTGQIAGNFTAASANDLAVLLRAGALPAPLKIIEERSVGPDLGADSIRAGIMSVMIGLVLVMVYMVLSYGLFGLFADIALLFNILLTVAALSLMQATLTLPGIAGILLTVGMSVDANILINERIREETKNGKGAFSAMEAGFSRALSTIIDANLTTLIKMAILFAFGTGVIKGFAVTISIGILTSMFTATVLVRLMMTTWLRRTRPKMLAV